jgi:hypothetical protein
MSAPAEKARTQRVDRLKATLQKRLEQPPAALETLITELLAGEPQTELWEQMHAAAARDGMEEAMSSAYVKLSGTQRMQKMEPKFQAEVMMHAADFFQGVLGDAATAENFLERVQHVAPGHKEAFVRLERRLERLADSPRLLELYALVAPNMLDDASTLAAKVLSRLLVLPAKTPLSPDACKRLVVLVPANPKLLPAIEEHCRKTNRPAVACTVLEAAVDDGNLPHDLVMQQRHKLLDLYMGEGGTPAKAINHVEAILEHDPADAAARKVADKLLSNRDVASRAAAALQKVRRQQTK